MKITIAGSLGNIGKPLTEILVSAGHKVTVITSSEARKSDIEQLGAIPAVGSVNDAVFLTKAFEGADAVFTMTPPNLGGANVVANTTKAGAAFADAIKKSGITRMVMLSSIGADQPAGTGPIVGLHHIELLYNKLENVSVTYLRAGYFYTNSYAEIQMIKTAGIVGANYPGDTLIPFVHPRDIAVAAAEELQQKHEGKHVRYVVSDMITADEYAKALGTAIGKPELMRLEFTDEQSLQGMVGAGVPEEIAGLYTEMGTGLKSGIIQSDFEKRGTPVTGNVKASDFAKEFAGAF